MSEMNKKESPIDSNYTHLGTALGMIFGAALGMVVWLTTDTFVFFPVFIGAGLTVGMAIGTARDKEKGTAEGQ